MIFFFGKRFYYTLKSIGQNVIELGMARLAAVNPIDGRSQNSSVILSKENVIDMTLLWRMSTKQADQPIGESHCVTYSKHEARYPDARRRGDQERGWWRF
jgi:hypothetical protein